MIIQHFAALHPPKIIVHPRVQQHAPSPAAPLKGDNGQPYPFNSHYANKFGLTVDEYVRRDVKIRELAKGFAKLCVGARVVPANEKDAAKYGECLITQLYRSYADFEKGHHWDEECVYLIAAKDCNGTPIVTTSNYFKLL